MSRRCMPRQCLISICLIFLVYLIYFAAPSRALAEDLPLDTTEVDAEVARAQVSLDEAEERMGELEAECAELQQHIDTIQTTIDSTVLSLLEVQSELLETRSELCSLAKNQYCNGGFARLAASLLFNSDNFGDFLASVKYLEELAAYQTETIRRQQQANDAFEALLEEVNGEKDQQEEALLALESDLVEAQDLVDSCRRQLANATAEQAARIAELEAQATALASEQGTTGIETDDTEEQGATAENRKDSTEHVSDSGNTTDTDTVVPDDSTESSNPDSDASAAPEASSGTTSEDSFSDSWKSGLASAYGGSTDASTGAISYTATGAIVDDSSFGVAIPMSWSNYRSYYGKTIEISYNGMTVVTVINDCGYLSGGTRSLDLQPGVWRAFGFSSCNAWGVRTVSYRIL